MRLLEQKNTSGFTLIELLVVISIISILSAVTWASFSQSSKTTRDAERQSDLKIIQTAIETYKKENGRYPAQCPTSGALANGWSGQIGTDYACSDGSGEYILGLKPYLPVLPTDPKLNGTNSGYVYRTNAAGTVYKIKAQRTVESDTITYLHPLKPCDIKIDHRADGSLNTVSQDPQVIGWCGRIYANAGYSLPNTCRSNYQDWSLSYGLWGGMDIRNNIPGMDLYAADPLASLGASNNSTANQRRAQALQDTTAVICK